MQDQWGRIIDYARISLTDRCNMRCVYCMPEAGVEPLPHKEILTYEEILRLADIFQKMGLHKLKLTGGEPLVRKGCTELVRQLKQIPGVQNVTLTTNGTLLADHMEALASAGIDGINISLDTLNKDEFEKISRTNLLEAVLAGIQRALDFPDIPVKINCVPLHREPDMLLPMAELARTKPLHVRFIEMMPMGLGQEFPCVTEAEILELLEAAYGRGTPCKDLPGNGPGHYYRFDGFVGEIGFISALSHRFCGSCNRVRLTADGFFKACLQYGDGVDVKHMLRQGCSDSKIQEAMEEVLRHKPQGHHFQEERRAEEGRLMAQIGG